MRATPRTARPPFPARAGRPRLAARAARVRAVTRAARARAVTRAARPRLVARASRRRRAAVRAIPLLAVLAFAGAALLRGDSPPAPAEPSIAPLRVSSGHGVATGFAVADGRVVTVAHVLDGPVTVGARRVRVVRVDRRNDLALLSVPGVSAAAPDIASAADGEHLRVIRLRDGRSSSLSVHVRRSIVAHVREPGATRAAVRPALELSALERRGQVAPGDSGAAVVTDSGELAGVVFAASRSRPDTAYAVDASELRRLLRGSSVE